MLDPSLLAVLQLADGLFPAGGFAHSFGLETYVQDGRVRDARGLAWFIAAHLAGSAGPSDAVAVALAARLARSEDAAAPRGVPGQGDGVVEAWRALDARLEAMKTAPETRAASRQMGRQTLRAIVAIGADPALAALARASEHGSTPAHHAAVFGAALGRAGVEPAVAALAFLHATAALLVGAGLRLLALGQVEGQRVLIGLRPTITRLAEAASAASADDMWTFTPAIDIASVRHETLDGRLFRS